MPTIKKKRGRPLKRDAKRYRWDLRINDDQRELLDALIAKTGKTRTQIVGEALDMYIEKTLHP